MKNEELFAQERQGEDVEQMHKEALMYEEKTFLLKKFNETSLVQIQNDINELVNSVEDGYTDALDGYVAFQVIEKLFKSAKEKLDSYALDEADNRAEKTFTQNGYEFTKRQGYKQYDFKENNLYAEKNADLEELKKLIKMATDSPSHTIVDNNGECILPVSVKYTKDSLVIKKK